jgi:hypothetical protein
MRTLLAAGLLLVLPFPTFAEDLWPRAVEWGSAFQHWLPGTMVMVSEMLDKEGKAVETTEVHFRLSQKPGGELDQELLQYVKNGRDLTAAKKAEMEKARAEEEAKEKADDGKRKAKGDDGEASIGVEVAGVFHPDLQKGTQVKPGVQRRAVGGRIGLEHAFTQKQKDGSTVKGTAWLDRESGLPLEVDYVPDPLPKYLKSLISVIRYGPGAGENWHAVEMVSEGVGGILFIKKRFRFTMKFGDYFQYPPPAQR